MYFTGFVVSGVVRPGQLPDSIRVLGSADGLMPIGEASCVGQTKHGAALWKLVVHGREVEGRWVIMDRQFIRVQ
jgi:hypothetical protein